jgi:hypothetical protein
MKKSVLLAGLGVFWLLSCSPRVGGLYVYEGRTNRHAESFQQHYLQLDTDGTFYYFAKWPMGSWESDGRWWAAGRQLYLNSRLQYDSMEVRESYDSTVAGYSFSLKAIDGSPEQAILELTFADGQQLSLPLDWQGNGRVPGRVGLRGIALRRKNLVEYRREPLVLQYDVKSPRSNSFEWVVFVAEQPVFSYEFFKERRLRITSGGKLFFPKGLQKGIRLKRSNQKFDPPRYYRDLCCPKW